MKSRFQLRRISLIVCVTLLLGALLSLALSVSSAPAALASAPDQPAAPASGGDPAAQVRRAWELSRLAGKYAFASDLIYTTYPALALANAGRGPQRNEMRVEGAVDLPGQKLEAKYWQGGSALMPDNGGEARIEGDRAYVRSPGGEWQETAGQGLSSGFAPGADPLAFLSGMTNVRQGSADENAFGVTTTHYVFDIDGPAFAAYLRDQLEQQLRDSGKLPLNVNLDTSEQFRRAQGSGEVWLDGRGLPLRLVVRLAFPAQENGARVDTDVRTDFSGYPQQIAQQPQPLAQPLAWARATLDTAFASPAGAARTAGAPGSVLCGFGVMALLIGCRRSRRLYAVVVIAVCVSMVFVPLMQSGQVSAYFERQNAQRAAQSVEQTAAEEASAAAAAMSPDWNPQQDPLTAGRGQDGQPAAPDPLALLATTTPTPTPADSVCNQSDTSDPDADGVNNYEECLYTTLPNDADTDDDGLTDSQELNRLGTDPTNPDTDGDSITDKVETQGWLYDKMWYLNPKNADTNGDGVADGIECPTLIKSQTPGAECDTDGDRTPDPFDRDDDNDGVPDKSDLSPTRAFSRSGLGIGVPAASAAFDKANPLQLSVAELQPNWPALVDIQLRPTNPDHLAYALNVLDWPVDAEGQIQHAKSTTFADSDNPEIRSPQDVTAANGDMRLIPLLELTITGKEAPLKLADPQVQVAVRGAFSATIGLSQQAANHANTDLSFKFATGGSYDVTIYDGSCPGAGAPLAAYKAVSNGAGKTWTGMKLNDLADGSSSLVVSQSGKTACADIPDLVTGPYTDRMIDQAALTAYGATASDSGGALLVYVPLSVVHDESGGGKTAFQARMLYWPGSEANGGNLWQEPQQARVVWAVDMITDQCDSTGFPSWTDYQTAHPDKTQEDYDKELDAHCAAHRTSDQMQVIQTYDESWYLTGLSVREDHGLDVSIAYPNPAVAYDDDGLWGLSYGLSQQFMPGEDCESDATILNPPDPWTCRADGKRDISIFTTDSRGNAIGNSTISGRFDAAGGVTGPARWGIPQNSLRVEDFRYPNADYMTYLVGHDTPAILKQFDTSVEPTLLYTREERYRLEGLTGGAASGSLLTINLAPGSHPEELTTGMNWAPYRYNPAPGADGAVIGWEAYPPDEYWDKLDDVLRARFQQLFPGSSADEIEGEMLVARSYYVALMSGVTQAVLGPIKAVVHVSNAAVVNSLIKVSAFMVYSVTANILGSTLKTYMKYKTSWDSFKMREALGSSELPPTEPSVRKSLFESVTNFFGWRSLFKAGPVAVGVGLALVAVTALVIALCFSKLAADATQVGLIVRGLLAVNVAVNAQLALSAFASAMSTTQSFGEWAKSLSGGALKIGIVVLAVKVIITWALFAAQCALGGWKFGSMAMDNAAAAAVASTITAVLLFAIFTALGGLGALIGAFIGLLDAIVGLMCNAFLTKEQQQSKSSQWLCGGITGIISGVIKWLIYSGALLPNLAPDKEAGYPFYPRLTFGNFRMALAEPERGMIAGNRLSVSVQLTNTIALADPPKSALAWAWSEQWSDDNLRRSTFAYRMQEEQQGFDKSLHLGQMEDEWRSPYIEDAWSYKETVSSNPITLTAGLNHAVANLYLSEAFAVPEQECWGLLVGGCGIKTERATNHFDLGSDMILDVLPANLDDFRRLSATGRKWTLAWGWEGELPFPAQNDADGDGLPADADVNDSKWDTDGDGLSDLYEQEIGSDPLQNDADGDGLWDSDEAQLGINPRLKDTDGDGLTDKEELDGWEIAYGKAANGGQLTTRITSDPSLADADGDGLTDKQEQTFGFNPNTPSSDRVLTLNTQVSEDTSGGRPADGVVTPGEKLYATATVKNELDLRQAEGLLSTQATSLLDKASIPGPKSFVLNSEEEATTTGELVVDPNAAAGAHSLTQVAGALITDWRARSGGASLWLRFDDAPGATSYADTSGYLPAQPGTCVGGGCAIVSTGRYGNGIHLDGKDYVHSNAPVSAGESSVAFWFKGDSADPGTSLVVLKAPDGLVRANIFLSGGQVCSRVVGVAAMCSAVTAMQWHHVAVSYSTAAGGKSTLYVDGRLIGSVTGPGESAQATTWNVNIGGGWPGSRPLAGTFDDVRLYPRVLTAADARGLAHQPLFHMDFETNSPWKDVSAFNAPVSCSSPYCPALSVAGAQGNAGLFNGRSFLNVASSPQLDLSAGQYSMSAWVYADTNCGFDVMQGNQNGYIIGMDNRNVPYPSMYLGMDAGNKTAESVGAYFSPQTTGTYYVESEDLVPLRKWVHLVITFDVNDNTYLGGTWRLYSNGKQVWTQRQVNPGEKPQRVTNFQVGLINALQDKTDHSFCGKLDELMIYNETLDADTVAELTRDAASALHVALDDAPGASAFQDSSAAGAQLACGNSGCPTSGLEGRQNRAAQFTGGQRLELPAGPINRLTNQFTVAAWVKPDAVSGRQAIAAHGSMNSSSGWSFMLVDSDLALEAFGGDPYRLSNALSGGAQLQAKRWRHVAAVFDAANAVSFYIDGQFKGKLPAAFAPAPTGNGEPFVIGAQRDSTGSARSFGGMIDDVWVYGIALDAEQIKELYDRAPVMHFAFEDAVGATTYQDSARAGSVGSCSGGCPTVGEGVRGQVGLAAEFDGVNDVVSAPYSEALNVTKYTVGAWVRPLKTAGATNKFELISQAGAQTNFALTLDDTMIVSLDPGCGSSGTLKAATALMPDHWNHVMASYDGQMFRLYLNGSESARLASAHSACAQNSPVRIGGRGATNAQFAGRMDEVMLFNHALPAADILDTYNYQVGWVEDRQSRTFIVDRDPPAATVAIADGAYLANQPIIVTLKATDDGAGVASADLGVAQGASGGSPAWSAASECADADGGPAWCATFAPGGSSVYRLYARATDRVGRVSQPTMKTVNVDDGAPSLTLDLSEGQRLDAVASDSDANTWLIPLSGAVSDPAIASGAAGSGIPADAVRVTLRTADGKALGDPDQVAAIADGKWSLAYRIRDAQPSGCYSVNVAAVDNVARLPNLAADQLERHTARISRTVAIDAAAPAMALNEAGMSDGTLDATTKTITGEITDRPARLEIDFENTTGAELTTARLTCQYGGNGAWQTLFDQPAGSFTPGVDMRWVGRLRQGSNCKLELTTTAPSGGVGGVIKVCTEGVKSWPDEFSPSTSISFVVQSGSCAANGCVANPPVAGAQKAEIAFTPLLPGSGWLNEKPPAAEMIHVPFDDSAGQGDPQVMKDVSGVAGNITCSGSACPAPGQPGHAGSAALFDGVDDAVYSNYVAGYDTTDYLTVAAWIKPTGNPGGDGTFIARKSRYVFARGADGTIRWAFSNQSGFGWHSTGYKAPLNAWTHLVFVYDKGAVTTYANGAAVHSATTQGSITNNSWLEIGGYADFGHFAGLIDDARVINRALPEAEVKALYTGAGPALVMSFEEPLAKGGDAITDSSGWALTGALRAGANDAANKTMTGEVGNVALKLDGVDDAVSIDNFGVFTTTTISAWIYRAGATDVTGRETIVSYKEDAGCGAVLALQGQAPKFWVHTGGRWLSTTDGAAQVPVNQWTHLVAVHDGAYLRIYQNGQRIKNNSFGSPPAAMDQCDGKTAIGSHNSLSQHWFPGGIDDVRVYGRALSEAEIQDLYNAGWRAATFTDGVAGAESASYSTGVPAGLQGAYQVEMRGVDTAGHAAAVSDGAMLWQGEVDNVKPAVTLCRALVSGSMYRYVAVAQDFNLTETGFASPCSISSRGYFQSPWLVAGLPAGAQKLNEARAECQSDSTATPQATACDSAGNCNTVGLTTGGVCDALLATSATVSAAPDSPVPTTPALIVAPTVLTATHYSTPGIVAVTGYITGTTSVTSVEVEIDGAKGQAFLSAPASSWPYTITWSYPWQTTGPAPDGRTVIATVAAQTGRGPQIPAVEQLLTVDVIPPAAVPLTLNVGGLLVEPGSVLRFDSAELRLGWGTGQDGSGIAGYTVNWTATSAATTTVASRAHAAGDLEDRYTAREAQRIAVELTARDANGNTRSQQWGSVVVDGPLTPDFVLLPPADARRATPTAYKAWVVGDCALLSADTRAARIGVSDAWPAQELRGSWDSRGLRLAWTGANWSGQGDIFVYLDTAGGGTRNTYAPFPVPQTASQLALPPAMAADMAVWVRDSAVASLLKWDGAAWQIAGTLSAEQYRFDATAGPRTDLYLPFEMLGMQPGGSLSLVAFATEEPTPDDGLRVWATAPGANPTNSSRSNMRATWVDALAGRGLAFPLLRYYNWPTTGDGVCPNGSAGGQSNGDVQVSGGVSADPAGATIEGIGGGIFWVENPAAALWAAASAGDTASGGGANTEGALLLDLLRSAHVPLPDKHPISYTLRVANTGSQAIRGGWLALSAYGPLRLSSNRIEVGDIPAGEERTVTFSGVVDLSISTLKRALALAQLYSSVSGPDKPALEWFVAIHRVDRGGPEDVGLRPLESRVNVVGGILRGFAQDESGVTRVTAEITGPSGAVTSVLCPAPEAHGGAWSCAWDATAANGGIAPPDGATFSLRLQATDRYDQVGEWSAPTAIRVDAQPPTFTVASAAGMVHPTLRLSGVISDTVGIAGISACVDNTCRNVSLAASGAAVSTWSLVLPEPQAMDYVSRTVTLAATDTLGNATRQPWQAVIAVDNVAPRVEVTQIATQLPLGAKSTVLQGKSTDGGPFVQTVLLVQTPDGALRAQAVDASGAGWSADLLGEQPGRYLLTVETRDLAGNLTTAGPFAVGVTCVAAELAITGVTAGPTDGMTTALTLKATLANHGPDAVSAGIPVGFYNSEGRLAALNTAVDLPAGGTETLTLPPWVVPAEGKYTVYVVPDDPDLGQASPVTLCRRPATSAHVVRAGPQPEPQRVYLPALIFQPAEPVAQIEGSATDAAPESEAGTTAPLP